MCVCDPWTLLLLINIVYSLFFLFIKTFKWFLLFYSAGIARVGYQMRKEKGKTDAEKIYYGIASAMDDLSRLLDDGGVYI